MAEAHPDLAPKLEETDGRRVVRQIGGASQQIPKGLFEVEERTAAMDRQGVDIQVLSLLTSQFRYDLDADVAADFTRIHNDAFVEFASQNHGRFAVLAHLPLQNVEASLAEIGRVVGFDEVRGVVIGTNIVGKNLDDPSLEPVWGALEASDLPVWVHPDHRSLGKLDRINKYNFQNNIGNPLDTTIAIGVIIHGGILERHPKLRFGFSHGGGFAPYQIRRWDVGWERKAATREHISCPPSTYFERMFFDTLTFDPVTLSMLAAQVGWDQIVVGSDYPMGMMSEEPVQIVRDARLPKSVESRVLGANAERFMRKVG